MDINWPALRSAAILAATRAYAPYSGLRVGAAGCDRDGTIVTGCNVENASYGLTLCAECGLVSAQHEAGGPDLLLDAGPDHGARGGPAAQRIGDLLPGAFTGADLASRSEQGGPDA
jgi:hypothetical protein